MSLRNKSVAILSASSSQKYMQHKLDLVYNKYVQNTALNIYLAKKYKNLEVTIDEQLSHLENIYQVCVEDEENTVRLLHDIRMVQDVVLRINFLENALEKACSLINDKELIKKIESFNEKLNIVCGRLCLKEIVFEHSQGNYDKLQNILMDISTVLTEIRINVDNDLLVILDNICKINDLCVKLRRNQDIVSTCQTKINTLTLMAASMEFSKK